MRKINLALALILFWGAAAQARDVYVSNVAGDDRHDGYTPNTIGGGGGPCRTIAKALRVCEKGDRIILENTGQPYHESITLQGGNNSGTAFRPLTIVGNGAVLDGSAPVPEEAWEHFKSDVFRFRPARISHQQLFLDGVPAVRLVSQGNFAFPPLRPLQWCLFDNYVNFRVEPGRIPQSYPLTYAEYPVGITLYEVRHVLIEDLIVQGFQLDGINAHDSAFDVLLAGVTARGNGRSGISVGGASRVKIEASLVGNNGIAQLRTEGWCRAEVVDCDLIPNTAPAWVRDGGRLVVDGVEQTETVSAAVMSPAMP